LVSTRWRVETNAKPAARQRSEAGAAGEILDFAI
jgi:hypothetical protein